MRLFYFKTTWAMLGIMIGAGYLDAATTFILLMIPGFYETNPLFYVLGPVAFMIMYLMLLFLAIILLTLTDHTLHKKIPQKTNLCRSMIIFIGLCYAALHLYLGARQLIWIIQIALSSGRNISI